MWGILSFPTPLFPRSRNHLKFSSGKGNRLKIKGFSKVIHLETGQSCVQNPGLNEFLPLLAGKGTKPGAQKGFGHKSHSKTTSNCRVLLSP